MNLVEHYATKLGKSIAEIMDAAAFMVGSDGPVALRWDEERLGPEPSEAELADVLTLPEAEPQTIVPDRCSKLGLKRALAETGTGAVFPKPEWPAVKDAIAKDGGLQEDWDLAMVITRNDPIIEALVAARKYDDATVDKIMIRANVLAV